MTIERTRQIFGNKIAHLSDEEILLFIQQSGSLVDSVLDIAVEALVKDKDTTKI